MCFMLGNLTGTRNKSKVFFCQVLLVNYLFKSNTEKDPNYKGKINKVGIEFHIYEHI